MLTIGDTFPSFTAKAVNPDKSFTDLTDASYPGKWKVYFFWPKDFTFVCPTEIAAFGKLNREFATPT
jgi:peroxiredoxin (alkyl hydroperoxide reductase subunit C)